MVLAHRVTAPPEASGDRKGTAPALFPTCSRLGFEQHVDSAAHDLRYRNASLGRQLPERLGLVRSDLYLHADHSAIIAARVGTSRVG